MNHAVPITGITPTTLQALELLRSAYQASPNLDFRPPGWVDDVASEVLRHVLLRHHGLHDLAVAIAITHAFILGYELGYLAEREGWDTSMRPDIEGEE